MPVEPPNTIVGLVDASGSSGGNVPPEKHWRLSFHLAAWRLAGSDVVIADRRCQMPVSHSELKTWMARIRPYQIIEAQIADDSSERVTILSGILSTDVIDPELQRIASELQKPIVINHPAFGDLQYDRKYDWYLGSAKWCEQDVEIRLICPNPEEPQAVVTAALRLFEVQTDCQRRIDDCAVAELLELKNDSWLVKDEAEVSREDFIARMTLESIEVDESGQFTFWHGDGGLFAGHWIEVRGDVDKGPTEADIAG